LGHTMLISNHSRRKTQLDVKQHEHKTHVSYI
jgi:hypothetical protein